MILHKSPEVRNVPIWLIWWFNNSIENVASLELSWHPAQQLFPLGGSPGTKMSAGTPKYHIRRMQLPKPEDRMSLLFDPLYSLGHVSESLSTPPTPPLAHSTHLLLARVVQPAILKTSRDRGNGTFIGQTTKDTSSGFEIGRNFP